MPQFLTNDDGSSNPSQNAHLDAVIERAVRAQPSRRAMLLGGFGAATVPFLGGLSGCGGGDTVPTPAPPTAAVTPPAPVPVPERILGFKAIGTSTGDRIVVPEGYTSQAFLPWGDPINANAPAFKANATNTAMEQEQQIGDNHDGMSFFGFNAAGNALGERSDEGLLVMNHEYINPEYFYAPDTDAANWMLPFTLEKARRGQAAHGVSVVHVRRTANGSWEHVRSSPYNRRIHGNTPIAMQGAAAGLDSMKTAADPTGAEVLGTLNNCGNGQTPWGTYLTCEENFNGYFGWNGSRTPTALESRYGVTQGGFGYMWHSVDPRFDVNATPNEPNRFGWIVEIDPFAPGNKPVKRSALGRFKHENAALTIASNGKVVVYMGCDERNEYVYKFVSSGTFDAANPTSVANRGLLGEGTLYAAKFDAGATAGDKMGAGVWIPLVHGQQGLTAANGFANQGEVLIRSRQAADRVGATMMDRPEWVAVNPKKPGEAFITLTNNNRRGTTTASSNNPNGTTAAGSARPAIDDANPRSNNVWGHIVRWQDAGGDATALTFTWDIFVMAGQPSVTGERTISANVNADNLFNSPDGLAFDSFGRMWIQTDGSYANAGDFANMGNNQMLVADPTTKEVRRFLVGPSGCEITGICFTPDRSTVFVNVQHPGEVGNHPRAPKDAAGVVLGDNAIARNPGVFSTWPAETGGTRPRAATVAVRRTDSGPVGT